MAFHSTRTRKVITVLVMYVVNRILKSLNSLLDLNRGNNYFDFIFTIS